MVCALHASMYLSLSSCLGSACGRLRWPKAVVIDVVEIVSVNVVKITFWLVKSYDFTSQNMLYGLNRLKKSKMGEIAKIGWNRDFRTDFAIVTKWCAETKSPPWSSCQAPIGYGNAQSRDSHHAVFTLHSLGNQVTLHNSQKTLSFFQPNKSLIG
jgi:hypothetical protein